MKKISLTELSADLLKKQKDRSFSYQEQYQQILRLMEEGKIKPVASSALNGKKPALHSEYWILEPQQCVEETQKLTEELLYHIVPSISTDYYLKHPKSYEQDRAWVLLLNEFFKNRKKELEIPMSWNERSFSIWQREKFLQREQGRKILKRCGIGMDELNVYETSEPLSYYVRTRETPQNLLIIENKDTFYSMRKILLEGGSEILGLRIGTLVYGAGKGILRSFRDFELGAEPYMSSEGNRIYYFGDLDYEGIGIYEQLEELFRAHQKILPFTAAYEAMLKKSEQFSNRPDMKEGQNRNLNGTFWEYFCDERVKQMKEMLEQGNYLPQEILNRADFLKT